MYKVLESIVSYIYSFYDKILIGSEGFEEIIKKRYKKEIIYFPNWAEVEIEQNRINFKSELKLSKENFTIMYTGNIGQAQGFDRIAKTIKILSKYKIYWVFIGGGSFKAEFVKLLKDYKVFNKCLIIDQINISKIPSYVYHADALLLSLNNDLIFTKTVPAKLQSYLALGKPVIGSISGEGAKVIKKSKSGIVEDTSDFVKLANKILKLSKLNKKELIEIGGNGKDYYDRNFRIELRKKQLLDLFQ
jgi:glycosyltransferase involved in cell wall biosynthesis